MTTSLRSTFPRFGFRGRALDFVPMGRSVEIAVELEELGYGAVWLPEMAGRDVFVHLGQLLAQTTRLVGASGVATIWSRDALAMSCAARALTEAFPERVLIGLGVSHRDLVQDVRGHSYFKPLSALREYLEAMDAAPYRAQRPSTPVHRIIGALGPKMLRLAAQATDGAYTFLMPPEHTQHARHLVGADKLLAVDQMVVLERDRTAALEIARARIGAHLQQPNYATSLRKLGFGAEDLLAGGSHRLVDALVVTGTVDDVLDRVRAQLDAGADHVSIQPLTRDRRGVPLEQWRELAPALRDLSVHRVLGQRPTSGA